MSTVGPMQTPSVDADAISSLQRQLLEEAQRAFITAGEAFRNLLPHVYGFYWLGRLTCWSPGVHGTESFPAAYCLALAPASA
jgi:hypothetical protein